MIETVKDLMQMDMRHWPTTLLIMVLGTMTNILLGPPIPIRTFFGQLMLAVCGSFLITFYGIMEGMDKVEVFFYGLILSLGGIHGVSSIAQIFKR